MSSTTMAHRTLHIARRIVLPLLAGLVLVAGALLVRVAVGPVSVGFLTPRLEKVLVDAFPGYDVDIDETLLIWDRPSRSVNLSVRGLSLLDSDGTGRAGIHRLGVRLSLRALLRGVVAVTEIVMEEPWLVLVRDPQGRIQIGAVQRPARETVQRPPAELPGPGPARSLAPLVELLRAEPDPSRPVTYLGRLDLRRAELRLDDRLTGVVLQVVDIDLALERSREGLVGAVDLEISLPERPARLHADVRHRAGEDSLRFDVTFQRLGLSALGHRLDVDRLRPVDLVLDGEAHLLVSTSEDLQSAEFEVRGKTERSPVTSIVARGTVSRDQRGVIVRSTQTLTNLPIHRAADYWPAGVASGAREWITTNIPTGRIAQVEAEVEAFSPRAAPRSVEVLSLRGSFGYEGLGVHFLRPVVPVEDVTGDGSFDLDGFDIGVRSATLLDLTIPKARVRITGLRNRATALSLEASVRGPLRSALTLLDAPRIDLLSRAGIVPDGAAGDVQGEIGLSVPLRGPVDFEALGLSFQGELRNGSLANVAAGRAVERAQLSVVVDGGSLRLSGPLELEGIPLTLEWTESLGSATGAVRGIRAIVPRLEDDDWERLGLDPREYVEGPVAGELEAVTTRDGTTVLAVQASAVDARLAIPALRWSKSEGVPAFARADVRLSPSREVTIDSLRVDAGSLVVEGRARFDSLGVAPVEAEARRFSFGETHLRGVSLQRRGRDVRLRVAEGTIDLAPVWERGGRVELSSLQVDRDSTGWKRVSANGGLPSPARPDTAATPQPRREPTFSLEYGPMDAGRTPLSFRCSDAGSLIGVLGWAGRYLGGRLVVEGASIEPGSILPLEARVRIEEVTVTEASLLARTLNLAQVRGLLEPEHAKDVRYDQVEGRFVLGEDLVTADSVSIRSASLGITGEGCVERRSGTIDWAGALIPARTLNRLAGELPVVGDIFHRGEGFLAVRYSLTGDVRDPKIGVHPLDSVTPEILRKLISRPEQR